LRGAVCGRRRHTPNPPADAKSVQRFFTQKFPQVKLEDFVNGPYSMNEDLHGKGRERTNSRLTSFPSIWARRCSQNPSRTAKLRRLLPNQGIGIRQELSIFRREGRQGHYARTGVEPLPEVNGEPPFSYVKDEMAALTAYMASHRAASRSTSKSLTIAAARGLPERQALFLTRRGQLNFSCATCHVQSPANGSAEVLAPALGS